MHAANIYAWCTAFGSSALSSMTLAIRLVCAAADRPLLCMCAVQVYVCPLRLQVLLTQVLHRAHRDTLPEVHGMTKATQPAAGRSSCRFQHGSRQQQQQQRHSPISTLNPPAMLGQKPPGQGDTGARARCPFIPVLLQLHANNLCACLGVPARGIHARGGVMVAPRVAPSMLPLRTSSAPAYASGCLCSLAAGCSVA